MLHIISANKSPYFGDELAWLWWKNVVDDGGILSKNKLDI